jgi:hypothetical protein
MQHRAGRIERDRLARADDRIVPPAAIGPLDRHHVVGKRRAETGVAQNVGPLLEAGGAWVRGSREFQRKVGERRHDRILLNARPDLAKIAKISSRRKLSFIDLSP